MNVYEAKFSGSTSTVVQLDFCACNATSCPHWQEYRFNIRSTVYVNEEPPPKPRPWIVERVPVVPRFKPMGALPWRPLQQRARDGTLVRHKTGGLWRNA